MTISIPMPDSITLMPRERSSITAAPIKPKMAPDAPRLGALVANRAPKEPASIEVK